jgi:hypothetical protein
MAEQFLHHMLGDARIYEPGPEGYLRSKCRFSW